MTLKGEKYIPLVLDDVMWKWKFARAETKSRAARVHVII